LDCATGRRRGVFAGIRIVFQGALLDGFFFGVSFGVFVGLGGLAVAQPGPAEKKRLLMAAL